MTRPEPTIYGNCDSWNFIVGKKPVMNHPAIAMSLLKTGDSSLMHNLYTILYRLTLDKLYTGHESTAGLEN